MHVFWTHSCVKVLWIRLRTSVRPYVRMYTYVRTARFFSGLSHRNYLIFCTKLGIHSNSKLTETDFLGKIWFSQNLGKRGQMCPKMWFFMFLSKSCPLMYIYFCLKSSNIMFLTILRKPHVWEKSGSWVMAQKGIDQSDRSIFQIWISQERLDRLNWFFAWCYKTMRGRHCT